MQRAAAIVKLGLGFVFMGRVSPILERMNSTNSNQSSGRLNNKNKWLQHQIS